MCLPGALQQLPQPMLIAVCFVGWSMWTGLVRHSKSTHKHPAWQLLHSAAEALKGQGACSSAPSPCPALVMPGMAYMTSFAPTAMTAEQDQTASGPPRKRVKHDAVEGTGAPPTRPAAQAKLQEVQAINRYVSSPT